MEGFVSSCQTYLCITDRWILLLLLLFLLLNPASVEFILNWEICVCLYNNYVTEIEREGGRRRERYSTGFRE